MNKLAKDATLSLSQLTKTQVFIHSLYIPWYVYTAIIASTSIVVGLLWDISWHMSIGRDAFLSPPHIAIYLGGILAGFGGAYQMFKTTFWGSPDEKAKSVWFWGFRAPLGSLLFVWGALAMLTSAPFDDWWHNAYGLDVKILSPPHAVLALGILVVQFGAVISLLAYQNQQQLSADQADYLQMKKLHTIRFLYTYTVAMLISIVAVLCTEYMEENLMHSSIYYQVACGAFPIFLIAVGRASDMKWPVTSAAAVYMGIFLLMVWILPLFPATPKLGPVLNKITHFVAFKFPILLVVPAIFVDLVMKKTTRMNSWLACLLLSGVFFGVLLITQWLFAYFYLSPYARNWFFAADALGYYARPDYPYRYAFRTWDSSTQALIQGLGIAFVLAFFSTRLGFWWGNWMKQVKR
ncbi:MAG: hypothetical protein NW226_11675 [Microscillaceae bacterium]|nr:hypothetical protein [Microscillaceae bacterium]